MSTKFLSPGWRMPRNANQSKSSNYSLDFNSSPYIDTNLNTGSYSSFSVSAWIKADTLSSGKVVAAQTRNGNWSNSSWLLYVEAPGGVPYMTFYMMSGGSPILAGKNTVLSTNQWYHIVATWDGATSKMYIDGVKETTEGTVSSMNATPINTLIGSSYDSAGTGTTGGWDGLINEVSIFDYALSQSQVTTLWGGGTSVSNPMALPSPPIAYYPLGGSAGGFVGGSGTWLTENNAIGDYVFDFDGSSGYVDYGYEALTAISGGSSTLTTSMSISIWFKLNNSTSEKGLIYFGDLSSNYGGFTIRHYAGKFNFLKASSHIVTGGYSFTDTTSWHNMTLVYDPTSASNCYLYIDGSDTGVTFNASVGDIDFLNSNLSQRSLIIGTYYNTSYIFNGELSNAQIFNSALSSTDVEALYNNGSPIKTLANIPQNSNLKAWYKLDASEVFNSSSTEWEVNNALSPWTSSLDFDAASSDYIDCGASSFNSETGITVSGWIYPTSTGTGSAEAVLSTEKTSSTLRGFYLSLYINNEFRWQVSTNGSSKDSLDAGTILLNQWSHIAATWNQSTMSLYVNGSLAGTMNTVNATGTFTTTNNIFIAKRDSSAGFFPGSISNASIWNTALTSTQVSEIYNEGVPSNLSNHSGTSNLVSWWKLNNTTTGIEDAKGSNNGTNNGATEIYGSVSTLNGTSSGMSQANLVQSDLQTVAPYSKYALDFDSASSDYIDCGQNTNLDTGDLSASMWINKDSTSSGIQYVFNNNDGSSLAGFAFAFNSNNVYIERRTRTYRGYTGWKNIGFSSDVWHHLCITYNDTSKAFVVYLNGVNVHSSTATSSTNGTSQNITIGENSGLSGFNFDGKLSNASIWNAALTSAQVTEIYNEGLPSNLNSHSAYSNLVSWWQLGENSSFDGNDWICADEKGTNNGTSTGMPVSALTNGVGTTANGVSTGMSEGSLIGDAPYSTANAISSGMAVTAKGTDVP